LRFHARLGRMLVRTYFKSKLAMTVLAWNYRYLGGRGRRIRVWGSSGQKCDNIWIKNKAKRTRSLLEHLSSKQETLSSDPILLKKKERKESILLSVPVMIGNH
jgi:hypothetical protein